jgi:hypothetical protein
MEAATRDGCGGEIAGLIVADGSGQYYAIAWDDLKPHRVHGAWLAPVAALVHGAEPAAGETDVAGHAGDLSPSASKALLLEVAASTRSLRLAAQRLEAWVLLR